MSSLLLLLLLSSASAAVLSPLRVTPILCGAAPPISTATPLVFIDGQYGTTALRLRDYLAERRDLKLLPIPAHLRRDPIERSRLLNDADIAVLCLPDEAARAAVALVRNPSTCIIDASTAHRTTWAYGLPELAPDQRDRLRQAKRIANPGCHATAFILAVRPLVDTGVVPPRAALTATSITGYTGGGRALIEQYEAAASSPHPRPPRPYALTLRHKHLPEMSQYAGLEVPPLFEPMVGAFARGLCVSIPLPGISAAAVRAALHARYDAEPFIHVSTDSATDLEDGFFDVEGAVGTNRVDLFVFGDDANAVVKARLDNLGKGASGAVVQTLNLHLGFDEGLGL